jgi:hypothetical protein
MSRPIVLIPTLAAAFLALESALAPVVAQEAATPPIEAATPGAQFPGEGDAVDA